MALLWKNFAVPVTEASQHLDLKDLVAKGLHIPSELITGLTVKKKSLDARKKSQLTHLYQIEIEALDEASLLRSFPFLEQAPIPVCFDPVAEFTKEGMPAFRHKPLIIGSGPAGIFTALCLRAAGVASHVLERGEPVAQRLKTVNQLRAFGRFNPESNFCFGEGGAGTFSDGKLTCGRNHPLIKYVFEQFLAFGAPASINFEAHPHIGTDYLMQVALKMRASLSESGCEFSFNKIFKGFRSGGSKARYLVECADGDVIPTDHLVIAIGHSARDTYERLLDLGLAIAPKPFAMGARIEHPQDIVNNIQYGSCTLLPAAEYKLAARHGERGIWTFCMCPGGHLLPTQAQEAHLAINGMSYHARNSGYANAAVVVNVLRDDFYRGHPLDGMHFQAKLERAAYTQGGGNYASPAQRLPDFLAGRSSKGELKSTYKPGVTAARLDQILPDFITEALQGALKAYNQKMRGFISSEALVVGLESKTSSPITMLRGKDLQSLSHPGLFPCGEGAGFAGGIVSAALDGVRTGQAILQDRMAQKA